MAGHRKGTDKGKRCSGREAEHERRVAVAPTGEAQLAAAFDFARSVAYRHPDRARVLHRLATELVVIARLLGKEAA